MKLYEVTTRYQQLMDKEELDLLDEQELTVLHEDIEQSAINIASYIRNLEEEMAGVNHAIFDMKDREASLEKKIESRKKFLLKLLEDNKIERITSSPYFVIKIRKGREKVALTDKDAVPRDYYRRSDIYTLNKELIKFDIDKGINVPGARIVKENSVEIK